MAAAMARAMPVLPEVASIRVSPGLICPRNSARVIIDSAGRSLTEPAGLFPSSLSNKVLLVLPGRRCKRTNGVLPTQSAMVGYCKVMAYSQSRLRGRPSYRERLAGHITQSVVLIAYGNKRGVCSERNPTQMGNSSVGTRIAHDDSAIHNDVSGQSPRIFPAGFGGFHELVSKRFH